MVLAETVREALPVPLPGETESQPEGVEPAVAVQVRVPPPLLKIAMVSDKGVVPVSALKV